jgi:cytochrome P450
MKIPKDTVIFMSIWAIHHDENMFPDPETFNPDRYLMFPKLANDYANSPDYDGRDHYGYGAGRRICPGIHLAERSMWRIAAKLLWAFEFAEPIDPTNGKIISLDTEAYSNGIIVVPHRFNIRIKPRGAAYVNKIRSELSSASDFLKQYD